MYSYLITLKKGGISAIIFGAPLLLDVLPSDIANITVSAMIVMVFNWAKHADKGRV